ncbi:hypothetical protein KDI_09530 [Dictyobacter arantiisoli]|uniref:Tetratricopeptide repeat protein n=2 Tax=Dictyobacter arantiisoli TaxID=2014874 RepID=A0A5A5T8S9_9CHLR|nr:hypothetical protein KDI_09530 [Dictyobacter arantiisoli]
MLIASILPWFNDPGGTKLTAWQLPVDLGWQLRFGFLNYGLLCTCCTLTIFTISWQAWQIFHAQQSADPTQLLATAHIDMKQRYRQAYLLCLLPSALFLFQFLVADMGMMAEVARNQIQLELARSHFGYATMPEFMPILPFTLHPLHLSDRIAILFDQIGLGFFMPLFSLLALWLTRAFWSHSTQQTGWVQPPLSRQHHLLTYGLALLGILILGRPSLALLSHYQAVHALDAGNYSKALQWLDQARLLNPTLDALPDYHSERGQAQYFLHPQHPGIESETYLGAYYLTQNDIYTSYQTLQNAWHAYPHTPWLRDELSIALAQLAEMNKPLNGPSQARLVNDEPALPWLDELINIDSSNVYAQFTTGRILCELHAYGSCEAHMRVVLNLQQSPELRSAAYTYIAISRFGLGDTINAREYLYKAQDFDPSYRNNTARQYMSGMR